MTYKVIMSFLLLASALTINGQTKVDLLVQKLNKFYKENRVNPDGKIDEIFINKTSKTIDIDNHSVQLDNYTANYKVIYDEKKTFNTVYIQCLGESECMYSNDKEKQNTSGFKIFGFGMAFKSKKACYEFINLIDEIKQLVLSQSPSSS